MRRGFQFLSGLFGPEKHSLHRPSLRQVRASELLREKSEGEDEDAKRITEALDRGNLVPNEITIRTLKERLEKPDCQKGYILDGYPRNDDQFQNLDSDIDKVFYVAVSDEETIKRLSKRGRHDDTGQALKRRMELYHSETEPMLDKFRDKGILEKIDGERTIEEIAEDIESKVADYAKKHAS